MGVTVPSTVSVTNVDAGIDQPKLARPDIKALFDAVNTLLGQINALGIMQIGDGVDLEAQGAGTKDKLKIKLDGGAGSGLAVSSNGLKIAANAVTRAMFERGATSGQVLTAQGSGTDAAWVTPSTGEANTLSNIGTGAGWWKQKVGVNHEIKSAKFTKVGSKPSPSNGGVVVMADFTVTITVNADDLDFRITPTWTEVDVPPMGMGTGI